MDLFGWQFKFSKKIEDEKNKSVVSFVPKDSDDGSVLVAAGGGYGTYIDLDGSVRTEAELVTKYREMAMQPECDAAIEEIVNESLSIDENNIIDINLDEVNISDNVKKLIRNEFLDCIKILNFNKEAYNIYRRWYIDGRLYFHVIIDDNDPKAGIKELRYVDPRKIRKIKEVVRKRISAGVVSAGDTQITKIVNEYFVFNDKGFSYGSRNSGPTTTGLKIAKDAVIYVTSGLTDNMGTLVLSYLHKCIAANERLHTDNGWKFMKDVVVGDKVLSYNIEKNIFEETVIVDKWCLGLKPIVTVKSRHTRVKCTPEHKILIKNKKTNKIEYIEAQNIIPKVHQIRLAHNYNIGKKIEFPNSNREIVYKIDPESWKILKLENKRKTIRDLSDELNLPFGTVWSFVYGYGSFNKNLADKIKEKFPDLILKEKLQGNCINELNLPNYVDEDFAQLFGFLLGDGWFNKYSIGFAEGIDVKQNEHYASLLERFFGNCQRINATNKTWSTWASSTTLGAELLKDMGFISGAINKRIPAWVFESERNIQEAFMKGFMDADGCYDNTDTDKNISLTCRINLANEYLIYDIKELWTSLGYSSGKVSRLNPVDKDSGIRINGKPFQTVNPAFCIFLSKKPLKEWENVLDVISENKEEEVYDITVKNKSHNFVVNGLITSNSIKALNQLRTIEDSLVIYRLVRAPERRIWYIDVGNLPKMKAEQYVRDIMVQHRNRLIYDASTGEVRDDRKFMNMMEDFWLPRREGGRGTEVTTLPGGQNLGSMEDVMYFQKKFYQALNVPVSRLNSETMFNVGKASEITRDELKFSKFVFRLRTSFSKLFREMLHRQLILKGIVTEEDWETINAYVRFDYAKDTYITELKDAEILSSRIQLAELVQPFADKYYSHKWIRKNVLKQSDDDIDEEDIEIDQEVKSGEQRWLNQALIQTDQMLQQMELQNQDMENQQAQTQSDIQQQSDQAEVKKKLEKIRAAKIVVDHFKNKKGNKSKEELSRHRSAAQIIAKNEPSVKQYTK